MANELKPFSVKPLVWEEAMTLATRAVYDDGRGMIGGNRRHLVERVARAIIHHERRILSAIELSPVGDQDHAK